MTSCVLAGDGMELDLNLKKTENFGKAFGSAHFSPPGKLFGVGLAGERELWDQVSDLWSNFW